MPLQRPQVLLVKRRKPKVLPEPLQFQHILPPIRGSPGWRTGGDGGLLRGQVDDMLRLIAVVT